MKKKATRKPAKALAPAPTAMRKGVGLSSRKDAPPPSISRSCFRTCAT